MYLSQLKIERKNKISVNKKVGRNFKGHITVSHRGGGHKFLKRKINWTLEFKNAILVGLIQNPQNKLSLFQWYNVEKKNFFYLPGTKFYTIFDDVNKTSTNIFRKKLKTFEIGTIFNNLGPYEADTKYIRSPGTFGRLLQKYTWIKNYVLVLLPSGESKLVSQNNYAALSSLIDYTNNYEKIKTAGRNRWLNKRPHVRGVAMNPVDHPHGGGEGKTSGGRPSVSPFGRLTKNVKTRKNKRATWQIFL